MIDNEDVCRLFVINSLRLTVQPDEKLTFHNSVPIVVKKKWWEKIPQKLNKAFQGVLKCC